MLCYQLSNEDAQRLHQVRAHDVCTFVASKAFQGGVFYPTALNGCRGIVFTLSAGKSLSGLYLRNHKV